MIPEILTCVLAFVITSCVITSFTRNLKKSKRLLPPCEGWIPWLGCAIEFGKNPIDFIEEKRLQVTSLYSTFLNMAEEYLTKQFSNWVFVLSTSGPKA